MELELVLHFHSLIPSSAYMWKVETCINMQFFQKFLSTEKAGAELGQVQDKLGLAELSLFFYYTLLASAS